MRRDPGFENNVDANRMRHVSRAEVALPEERLGGELQATSLAVKCNKHSTKKEMCSRSMSMLKWKNVDQKLGEWLVAGLDHIAAGLLIVLAVDLGQRLAEDRGLEGGKTLVDRDQLDDRRP